MDAPCCMIFFKYFFFQLQNGPDPAVPPSIHSGSCYLTRMFSRLVKEAVDLAKELIEQETKEVGWVDVNTVKGSPALSPLSPHYQQTINKHLWPVVALSKIDLMFVSDL